MISRDGGQAGIDEALVRVLAILAIVLAILVLFARSGRAEISLRDVRVIAADPGVLNFPRTARLDSFGANGSEMTIRTTGTDVWPAVSIDGGPPSQSATLWIFLNIQGQWYASGAERLRPSQVNGSKPEGGIDTLIGDGWFGKSEYGPLAGRNPTPGEHVGVMVVAGSTRLDNQTPCRCRTDLVEVIWPGRGGVVPFTEVWREGDTPIPTQTEQTQPTNQPVQSDALFVWARQFAEWARAHADAQDAQMAALKAVADDILKRQELAYQDLTKQHEAQKASSEGGNPMGFLGSAEFWKYAGSAIAGLITAWGVTR